MYTLTPQAVIAQFSSLTGIRIRIASHGQESQAIAFCKHFTLDELAAVIGWIQKQVQSGKLDERSLSWRNVFGEYGSGNEFSSFQDRLAMAQKTIRTRPEQKQQSVTRNVGNGQSVTVLDFVQPAETPPIDAALAAQLAGLRKSIGGAA